MKDTLLQKADTIRTERRAGGNTASRVGGLLSDLITWIFGELQLRPSHQQLSDVNHALTTLIGSKVGTDVVQALTTVSDRLNGEVARLNEVIVNLGIKRTPDDFYQSVFNHPTFKGMTTSIYVATIAESSSRGITFILKNAGQRWVTLYLFENYYIKKMVVEYADKTREVEQWRSGWREFLARRMEWKADTRTLRLHNNDGHSGTHSEVQIPLANNSQAGLMSVEDKSFIQEVRVALGPQKDGVFAAFSQQSSSNSIVATPFVVTNENQNQLLNAEQRLNVTHIRDIDTSQCTWLNSLFSGCHKLISIPPMNTSRCTSLNRTFKECYSLTTIPPIDTSNVWDMYSTFEDCQNLIVVPPMNTSKVTQTYSMFYRCFKLEEVPLLDMTKVVGTGLMFDQCPRLREIRLKGLKESLKLSDSPLLSKESILYLFNNAQVVSGKRIELHPSVRAKLTDEDIAIATNKGWAVA